MELSYQLAIQMEYICLDTILKIQKDLDSCDLISVMFLLCGSSNKAFDHVILNQLISNNFEVDLLEWGSKAQCRWTWKWELLDALFTCQLFSIIKYLGFHIDSVKQYFATTTISYVHPMKKVIYKICESMNNKTHEKIKQILATQYNITLTEHKNYEIMFLQLLSIKFFTLPDNGNEMKSESKMNVRKIVSVLEQCHELKKVCLELKFSAGVYNSNQMKPFSINDTSLQAQLEAPNNDKMKSIIGECENKETQTHIDDLQDTFDLLNKLTLEDLIDLKTDGCN